MNLLFDNYSYKIVERKDFLSFFKVNRENVFSEDFTIPLEKFYTKREEDFFASLPKSNAYKLYILIYYKKEVIGWHMGYQKLDTYYMMNTGIFAEHQGKGIYTSILPKIIEIIKAKGFVTITSRHIASNNKVLVPKLKAGFNITGLEIDERFGVLVNLTYFFNEKIKSVYLMRTGSEKPSNDLLN